MSAATIMMTRLSGDTLENLSLLVTVWVYIFTQSASDQFKLVTNIRLQLVTFTCTNASCHSTLFRVLYFTRKVKALSNTSILITLSELFCIIWFLCLRNNWNLANRNAIEMSNHIPPWIKRRPRETFYFSNQTFYDSCTYFTGTKDNGHWSLQLAESLFCSNKVGCPGCWF